METSSSRSQIPSRAEALKGEPFAANFSKALKEFVLGTSSPVLFIDSWRGIINYYYGASFDAALWDLSLIPPREHWSTNSATLFIRETRGKWLSQTLARSSGDFSVVLPSLATKLRHFRFVVLWQANCETRASTVTIFSREGSAVRFDDAARNGQPHSGSLGFCRKEWLEKLLGGFPRKARTRVTHADENVSIPITARPDEKASRIGGHSRHCFKGVEGEIEKHLQELHRISPNLARTGINFGCHFCLPSNGISVHNAEQLVNRVLDRD